MQDPIADMLTRLRNGQMAGHTQVTFATSKVKLAIVQVLKDEGYISDFKTDEVSSGLKTTTVSLKYYDNKPVIECKKLKRISRPGLRIYKSKDDLSPVPGFGIAILSTSQGVMTDKKAIKLGIGGEVICQVA